MKLITTSLRSGLLASAFVLLVTAPADATILFTDNFDSPNDTALVDTSGWSRSTIPGVSDQPVSIQNGQAVLQPQTSGPGENVNADAGQTFGVGTSFYAGFDFTADLTHFTSDTSGLYAGSVFYVTSTSASDYTVGIYVGSSTGGVESVATYSIGQTYRVVIEYINQSSNNYGNTTNLYINGTLAASGTTTQSDDGDLPETRYFTLRQENYYGDSSVSFDNLVLATTFAEAATTSAVPEPSAYAAIVGGLALACVVLRRRRA
jgi:hypothetical protein